MKDDNMMVLVSVPEETRFAPVLPVVSVEKKRP